jgi:putative flippase GtrA
MGASAGGIIATTVDIVTLRVLVELGVAIALAAFLGAVAGAVVQFWINKRAFGDTTPITTPQVIRFSLVALGTALLMAAAMHVVAVWFALPVLAAKLICALVVFAAWSFPVQRRFVFPRGRWSRDLSPGASFA